MKTRVTLLCLLALFVCAALFVTYRYSAPETPPNPPQAVVDRSGDLLERGAERAESSVQAASPPAPTSALGTDDRPGARLRFHSKVEQAPSWAIPYGKEFWRSPAKPIESKADAKAQKSSVTTSDVNLGDVIERVSHAFEWREDEKQALMDAKTFAVRFDGQVLRVSPNLPADKSDLEPQRAAPPEDEPGAPADECSRHVIHSNGAANAPTIRLSQNKSRR